MAIEGDRYNGGFFSPGDNLAASQLSDLAGQAARSTQVYSNGSMIAQGTFGTINLSGNAVSQSTLSIDYPYKVRYEVKQDGNYKFFVRAGTVNSFVSKALSGPMAGKYLDDTPTPYFDVPKGFTKKYVVLRATKGESSKFFPTDNDVYIVDSMESLADNDNEGHLLLASVTQEFDKGVSKGIVINQYIYSSQALIRVKGSSVIWSWASR